MGSAVKPVHERLPVALRQLIDRLWLVANSVSVRVKILGIVLGMVESFSAAYLSLFTRGAFGAEYKDVVAFGILILILIFRPSGLLGQTVGQKA
mgnify:CR=1 FL=1